MLVPLSVLASTKIGNLCYDLNSTTSTAEVTYYFNGTSNSSYVSGDLVIPETVDYNAQSYSVTSIGEYAFRDCSDLTSVTIPNSVTSIGEWAFRDCRRLTSVTIPNSVTSIGNYAFYGCRGLTSLEIPNSVTSIGENAFNGCSGLTNVSIGNSVASIGKYAFNGCSGLTSLEIPNSVTSIGDYAFYDCSGLTILEIPNSVTSIGNYAFDNCSGIKDLIFQDGVAALELRSSSGLFGSCPLEKVYIGRDLDYSSGHSYGYSPFANKKNLSSIVFGERVTKIPYYLLYGCSSITGILIPSSVISIGNYAFEGCTSIKEVTIEDGDTTLELGYNSLTSGLFGSCPLEKVYLGRNLSYSSGSSYGYSPFANQTKLTCVTISEKVTSLPQYLFYGCSMLNKFIYSPGSQFASIEPKAFDDECYDTTILYITVPEKAFEIISHPDWCKFNKILCLYEEEGYIPITWDLPVTISGSGIIYANENGALNIPGSDVNFKCSNALMAFWNGHDITTAINSAEGYSLKSNISWKLNRITGAIEGADLSRVVSLPVAGELFNQIGVQDIQKIESLKVIGNINGTDVMTINRMTNLKNLDLAEANIVEGGQTYRDNLKTSTNIVGSYFFYDCNNLQNLILPNSSTLIEANAFDSRSKLLSVIIGDKVKTIGFSAFENCTNLLTIVIPNSVTSVGNYAFNGCTSLSNVIFADGENSIYLGYNTYSSKAGKGLFADCPLETLYIGRNLSYDSGYSPFKNQTKLTSVTIGDNVTSLPDHLLYKCSGLTNITIPNSVTSIGNYAFYGCSGLTSIEIPNSVTSIGNDAFYGCSGLTSVTIPNSVISIGEYAFNNCYRLNRVDILDLLHWCKIDFGDLSANPLANAHHLYLNDELLTSIQVPDCLNKINPYVFAGGSDFTSVIIPNSITSIGSHAFYNCTTLNSIEIPNSVTSIGSYAFYNCSGLTNVTIPNSVASIENYAFEGCTSIKEVTIKDGAAALTLGRNNFSGQFGSCQLEKVYIGRKLTYSSGSSYVYSPFENQTKLTSVTIGDNVTSLPDYLLYKCSGLTNITIPNSVTSIGNYAFYGCSGLTSIEIPNSVTSIGNNAFEGCTSIKEVTIEDGETTLKLWCNSSFSGPFGYCPLERVYLGRNLTYSSGPSYDYYPFAYQTKLTSVTIGDNVTSLPDYLLYKCTGLTTITIPNSVTSIGTYAFYGCSGLESVVLGYKLTEIDYNAFKGCTGLVKLYSLNPTPPKITASVFEGVDKEACLLMVTKGNLVYYWLDPVWKEFLNMSDDLIYLNPIPNAKYGDAPIDLAKYAPAGVTLSYETSNDEVARLDGTVLSIVGAGEATIGASYEHSGTPMELLGQMRQFIVDKADLTIGVEDITIKVGEDIPVFNFTADGLVYDETLEDIGELPVAFTDANSGSAPGEYPIYLEGGESRNYNLNLVPGLLTILESDNADITDIIDEFFPNEIDETIRLFNLDGILIYEGPKEELTLQNMKKGIYIIIKGNSSRKVMIK